MQRATIPFRILLGVCLGATLVFGAWGESAVYDAFIAEPEEVEIFWLAESGQRYGQLRELQDHLKSKGQRVRMLMNGGIFEPGGIPSGLLVIDGKTIIPANLAEGRGNFFLKPNGVFFVGDEGGGICSTEKFVERRSPVRIAVQSGPLLVEEGVIHPAFRKESSSRLHRNGVGILPDGRVIFAATRFGEGRYPNLYEFAEFFRERGCRNALFLDGDISQMEVDPVEPLIRGNYFGSIIAVIERDR